ncbi:hypothetical protein [Halomonas sp. BM-2019]|uniref:hypothetical protein n=1 Tax=Halomonas sp. BM-2019 TaxID=2811227 RepID=UPI001B3C48BD|nr:MAG: hypothetical protein J5F18_10175 [Halomonas sp. BM-2019]
MLAYLALAGRPVSRNLLAELLWPEAPAGDGRASLRRALHRLQQRLGSGVILGTPDTIALAPEVVAATDAVVFREQLARSRDAADAPASLALLRRAEALYRDDFLAGFGIPECPDFEDWQVQQSEALRRTIAAGDLPGILAPVTTPTPVRYVVSGGVHIAYRLYGDGPLTLVALPGFVSHLDFYWEQPELARFMQALGRLARVLCFDKRGAGLSDRVDPATTPRQQAILDPDGLASALIDFAGRSETPTAPAG